MNDLVLDDPQTLLAGLCRHDFTAFLRKAWPWISGGEPLCWNWHLDAIAHKLDRIECGESRRTLINLPPRNAKSKTISVIWVAWMLGRDPTLNFVCVSYSNELSGKMARDCRAIMDASWYRELFPGTLLSRSRSASFDFETTRGGGRLATSVTGTLTGRGGDIIILDDVIKPEEANSETTRNAVNDWFQSTLASRLNDKATGAILCIMQRLHQYDLSGMLLEKGGWDHLSLPAIATKEESIILARGGVHHRRVDDVLHPEREPLDVLEELKASMGSLAFTAAARQAWLVAKDPHRPDSRVLVPIKSNIRGTLSGVSFRIESDDEGRGRVEYDRAKDGLSLEGLELDTPDAAAEQGSERDEACEFLRELLASGPVEASEVIAESERAGISVATLRRAKRRLGVVSKRIQPPGAEARWVWTSKLLHSDPG